MNQEAKENEREGTQVVAFRLPIQVFRRLMSDAKDGETQSIFMRRVVDTYLRIINKN